MTNNLEFDNAESTFEMDMGEVSEVRPDEYYTKEETDKVIADSVPTKVSELANDAGYMTEYTETDPTVPVWAKQSTKPQYTAEEVGALPDTTVIPTKVSDLANDAGYLTEHQDISGKANTKYVDDKIAGVNAKIPTKVSQLNNDSDYVPRADMDAALAKKQEKEHVWTAMYDEVLAEDRGSNVEADKLYALDLNFPGRMNNSCGNPNPTICVFPKYAASLVGLKILIIVPTDKAFGGGNLIVNNQVYEWVQNYQLSTYSANTLRPKIVDAQWIIEHGVSEAKCLVRTGASLTATTTNQCFKEGLFIAEYFNFLQYRGSLPAGTRIRVWGLFN